MRPALWLSFLTAASLAVAACGGSSSNPFAQGGGCKGTAPSCYGDDLGSCCSQNPTGSATCENGEWMCGPAGAPGCNGASCVESPDSGLNCIGTPPNCYGSDVQSCCSQDPSGPATCEGGQWRCGSAVAPGCSGTSCIAPQGGGPFACGPKLTCAGSEYCIDQPAGIYVPDAGPLADSFACVSIPSTCAATPTCACIEATPDACQELPVGTCSQDPAGGVTLDCIGE
jgi:hypothetical protein